MADIDPMAFYAALGTAVGLGGLLGSLVAIFNSWKPSGRN